MKKRLYFNGVYLILGYRFFGKISGELISTTYNNAYRVGDKMTVPNDGKFRVISEEQVDMLKKFNFIKDGK